MSEQKVENLIILGGGPAGYTAALYAARANLEPLVIEGFQWGGQLQNTTDVENYPGYPEGIMGPEMMNQFRAQAERFGTRFVNDDVDRVELSDGGVQKVFLGDEEHQAKAVILAMGAEPRRLGPARRDRARRPRRLHLRRLRRRLLQGRGRRRRSAAATRRWRTRCSSPSTPRTLTIVHRRDEFRASKIMLERAAAKPNIELKTPFEPLEFIAGDDGKLRAVKLRNAESRARSQELEVGGAFVAIGHIPRSELVDGRRRHRRRRLRADRSRARRRPTSRACSRSATSSTAPTARRSPPPAPAAWARSTPSGTSATALRTPRPPGRAIPGAVAEADRRLSDWPPARG